MSKVVVSLEASEFSPPTHVVNFDHPIAYVGDSIRKRVRNVLAGKEASFSANIAVKGGTRYLVYFCKDKIVLYTRIYEVSRHGGAYIDKEHSSAKIFSFKRRQLRVLVKHGRGIGDHSYSVNTSHYPKQLEKYLRMYFRHFGYKDTGIHKIITPLLPDKHNRPINDVKKACWRGESIKEVLTLAKLPSSRSIVKAMAEQLTNKNRPSLHSLHIIYLISRSVDVLKDAVYFRFSIPLETSDAPTSYTRALSWLLKGATKNERAAIARGFLDPKNRFMTIDFVIMARDVYYQWRKAKAKRTKAKWLIHSRSFRGIHDELSSKVFLIKNKDANKIISYDDTYKSINGVDVGEGVSLVLPKRGTDIREAGEKLHNCLAGYVSRAVSRDLTIILLSSGGQLTGAMEIRGKAMHQISGFANAVISKELFDKVFNMLVSRDVVTDSEESKPWGYRSKEKQAPTVIFDNDVEDDFINVIE